MSLLQWNNFATGILEVDALDTDTNILLEVGHGARFPTPTGGDYSILVLEDVNGIKEVVHLTTRVADTLTVTRGEENTTPVTFVAGSRIEMRATAGFYDNFVDGGEF